MANHDYVIDNGSGSAVRADINNALQAIASVNSSATDPSTIVDKMLWHDTTTNSLKQRNSGSFTGLRLFNPVIINTGLFDANGNEAIKFAPTVSAVNELTVTNAATGNAPILSATGDDTNINLTLTPKGTGNVSVMSNLSVTGNITGTILFPAGTVSNPSITTTNDTNTGLFFNAADNISVVTGGTNRLTVDSDGDVGIGTTSPAVPLHIVRETATTNAVTQALRIDSQSSGTPANGIGVGIQFATETTAANTEIGATIEAITTDITAASEDFDLSFKVMAAGAAAAEQARITSTGLLQFNSGYGSVATAFGCRAWVNFNGAANTNLSGTYSQSGTTVTVTATAHGLIVGNVVYADATSGTAVDGTYTVATVTSADVFTYTAGTSLTTSGNMTLIRNTIRASGNVSSITDNGTGSYTVNFTTAMPDANYTVAGAVANTSSTNGYRWLGVGSALNSDHSMTTGAVRVQAVVDASLVQDCQVLLVAIFR